MDPKGRGPATASLPIEPFAALDWNGRYLRIAVILLGCRERQQFL
jgi:hypothetical protein